jgi:hypothetical protein
MTLLSHIRFEFVRMDADNMCWKPCTRQFRRICCCRSWIKCWVNVAGRSGGLSRKYDGRCPVVHSRTWSDTKQEAKASV